jgi:(S)-mandelate dehydrogenase
MKKPVNIDDLRKQAKRRLPRMVYDFLEGGAGSERGLMRNRQAFDRMLFAPRRLTDVSKRDMTVDLLGQSYPLPLAIAPTGLNGVYWHKGDLALARVAARYGIPFCLSTASTSTIEDVARAGDGEKWFQLYVLNLEQSRLLVNRAKQAGYSTLILTADVAVNGKRERDVRNGFAIPFKMSLRSVIDCAIHPRWSIDLLRRGMPELANFASPDAADPAAQAALMNRKMDASFDWNAFARLRDEWPGKLLIKGLNTEEDVSLAEAAGADGVILSNHGGRQLEDVAAPIDTLRACAGLTSMPLMLDSGIRTGADVVKGLAAGACFCLLGRATLYGLAAKGEQGVAEALDILTAEMDTALALIGVAKASEVRSDALAPVGSAISAQHPC